jgi:hypothetical protein
MPSAISNAREPVEITSTFCTGLSPKRMAEPLPKFFSTWASAVSNAAWRRDCVSFSEDFFDARALVCCAIWPLLVF